MLLLAVKAACFGIDYPGRSETIPAGYFGLHIHHAANIAWPNVPFVGWRLWDAGVAWAQLEPERDKWDFSLLDRYVALANLHRVHIVLVLGLTPKWASSRPSERSAYQEGNAAQPHNLEDWKNYVEVVARRYKGKIEAYEIWNEPNTTATYTGTTGSILQLARIAYGVLKSVDPAIIVASPSANADTGVGWLKSFLSKGGCTYADVIAYHFYVTPYAPEEMVPLIGRVKSVLQAAQCNKPLWNTETGWTKPKQFGSTEEAAGYLMRSMLLNWMGGVDRFYWYAWDNHNWCTLELTDPNKNQPVVTASAYTTIEQWLTGATLRSCKSDSAGLWMCEISNGGSKSWIAWSTPGPALLSVSKNLHVTSVLNWQNQSSPAGVKIPVSVAPIRLVP